MKKIEFIEAVKHQLTGGVDSGENLLKYHPEVLSATINNYFEAALLNIYNYVNTKNKGFSEFDNYCKRFESEIKYDGKYYTELPHALASIPNKISLRRVMYLNGETILRMSIDQVDVLAGSTLGQFGEEGYYLEGNRIEFINPNGTIITKSPVYVVMIRGFHDYGDDEEISMPIGMNGTIFDLALQGMRGLQATTEDLTNNQNPNK
jgi:hypothetical protein